MSLTRDPKLPNGWIAIFYPEGRKKDPKTGKPSNKRDRVLFEGSETEARAWYAERLKAARSTKTVKLAPTLDQVYPDFLEYYRNKVSPRTLADFILTYDRHLKQFFGHFRPNMLSPGLFESYKTKRAKDTYLPGKRGQKPEDDTPEEREKRVPVSKRTVQKEITYIQSYVKWMTRPSTGLAEPLPFKIENYTEKQTEAPPKVIPSRREMILLMRACRGRIRPDKKNGVEGDKHLDRKYRAMFAIAYYAGLRRAELFALSGGNIDRQQGYLIIKGKGGKVRTVPIVTRLKPYIQSLPTKGRLFTSYKTGEEYDNVDRLLARTCEAVGMPIISMHTFRHAFAVHALMRGVSLRTLQLVMGHSTIKTTERYLRLVPRDLAADLDKVKKHVASKKPKKRDEIEEKSLCIAPKNNGNSGNKIIYLHDRRSAF